MDLKKFWTTPKGRALFKKLLSGEIILTGRGQGKSHFVRTIKTAVDAKMTKKTPPAPVEPHQNPLIGLHGNAVFNGVPTTAVFILGKCDEGHYIVQAVSAWDGTPNCIGIFSVAEMREWLFYPTAEMAEEEMVRYHQDDGKHQDDGEGRLRYTFSSLGRAIAPKVFKS